jgi:hypothetical protein
VLLHGATTRIGSRSSVTKSFWGNKIYIFICFANSIKSENVFAHIYHYQQMISNYLELFSTFIPSIINPRVFSEMYFNLPSNKFSYRFIIDIVLSEEHPSIIKYSIFRYFGSIQTQWCQKLFFWIIWCCNYCDFR